MQTVDVVIGILMLIGLAGIVVPILPGSLLIAGALIAWAVVVGGAEAWAYAAGGLLLLGAGQVVKYAVPGRRLTAAGVPLSTLFAGGALGVVGLFVVPGVGLLLGFVLGVYLAELRRLGSAAAWPSTKAAVLAAGLSVLIEAAAALAAVGVWFVGTWTT